MGTGFFGGGGWGVGHNHQKMWEGWGCNSGAHISCRDLSMPTKSLHVLAISPLKNKKTKKNNIYNSRRSLTALASQPHCKKQEPPIESQTRLWEASTQFR